MKILKKVTYHNTKQLHEGWKETNLKQLIATKNWIKLTINLTNYSCNLTKLYYKTRYYIL